MQTDETNREMSRHYARRVDREKGEEVRWGERERRRLHEHFIWTLPDTKLHEQQQQRRRRQRKNRQVSKSNMTKKH